MLPAMYRRAGRGCLHSLHWFGIVFGKCLGLCWPGMVETGGARKAVLVRLLL